MIEDWEKWMAEHHIKLRGDLNDNRSDEMLADRSISRTKVANEMSNDARKTSNCNIQESVFKEIKEESQEKRTRY